MHDPMTLAFDIYLGAKKTKNGHYRSPFITIWHVDPDTRGDDDSCGWFIRSRHIDKVLVEKVRKEFTFNFKHNYWFNSLGLPKTSTIGTVLNMYNTASWQVFIYLNGGRADRKRHDRFMRKYLYDIMWFAENPTDSLNDSINLNYGPEKEEDRIDHFTSIILADIMRKIRPWYRHPRWHVHHWKITFPVLRDIWRYYFQRCAICKKRGFHGQSAFSDWNGTKVWCNGCNNKTQRPSPMP